MDAVRKPILQGLADVLLSCLESDELMREHPTCFGLAECLTLGARTHQWRPAPANRWERADANDELAKAKRVALDEAELAANVEDDKSESLRLPSELKACALEVMLARIAARI